MEKELKQPGPLKIQGGNDEATPASQAKTAGADGRRAGDDEYACFAKRKRIRAYQKIDYWQ